MEYEGLAAGLNDVNGTIEEFRIRPEDYEYYTALKYELFMAANKSDEEEKKCREEYCDITRSFNANSNPVNYADTFSINEAAAVGQRWKEATAVSDALWDILVRFKLVSEYRYWKEKGCPDFYPETIVKEECEYGRKI